jgi:PPK2 family polyphosphate:nucleotide phosphotransferase
MNSKSYVTTIDERDTKIRLDDISTEPEKGVSREDAEARFGELSAELFELQDLLWGAKTHGVLIVLQGMDTAGKDGVIEHVAGSLNPRGINVVSFGVPTKEEIEHDFLWRVHRHAPRKGEFALFNRSHYEDVLVVRVNNLVPESLWKERFGHIRDFEELLVEHDTIVLKFFLHISKGEQERRLLDREKDPSTAWKLNVNDWRTREKWRDFQDAYEDVLRRCATPKSPWHIVPADSKWFRNLAVITTILNTLRPYKKIWQRKLDDMGARGAAELSEYRKQIAAERGKGGKGDSKKGD